MQQQSPELRRKNRFASIRATLQQSPLLKKNSLNIENKLQRRQKRKQSLQQQNINITQSQIALMLQKQNQSIKGMGKFAQKYQLGQKIGQGSNGLVRKCYLKSTGELLAVKTMILDDQHIMFLKSNFKFIKALNHQNIIKYHVMYLDSKKNTCRLVMDYNGSPNLLKFRHFTQEQIKHVIYQLIDTLSYIHQQNICHRDIKPQNILYDSEKKKITIIDFGISKKMVERGRKKQMLTITGSLYYRAPEMFLGGGYDQKIDMWAVGITIYEMIVGKTPFQSQYLSTTIQNIVHSEPQFSDQIWRNYTKFVKDLVIRLLKKTNERLNANEARKHFWFCTSTQDNINHSVTKSVINKLVNQPIKSQISNYQYQPSIKLQRYNSNIRWSYMGGRQQFEQYAAMKKYGGILGQELADSGDQDVMVDDDDKKE